MPVWKVRGTVLAAIKDLSFLGLDFERDFPLVASAYERGGVYRELLETIRVCWLLACRPEMLGLFRCGPNGGSAEFFPDLF